MTLRSRMLSGAAVVVVGGLAAAGLVGAVGALAQSAPGGAKVEPKGKMVLGWHAGIANRWLDPQEHDGGATPDNFLMALHDALIKNMYDKLFDQPALAEKFEFAEDAKSATFRLREGVKFHNGAPVTTDDIKFSFEQYRGAWSGQMKEKTEKIEIIDNRTVRFIFKVPFLDFPALFGTTNVTGAGFIVPEKYYKEVGPDGYKQKPVGAGPYKLVNQQVGLKLEMEAFKDYYRPVHVKQFEMIAVPEPATRVAMLERGEADIIYLVPGELINRVKNNSKLRLAPVVSGSWWLEFPGFRDPKSPFHDKRVREAISLAIDREAINDAESGGMGRISGNWINNDVQYALEWPKWPKNIERAKQLMKEAGFPNGFNVDWVTPVPNYCSRGERIVSQLQAIGIRSKLQTLERGVFLKRQQAGLQEWPGVQIILNGARIGASWANWYESNFKCGGRLAADRYCVKELDAKFEQYLQSYDPKERKNLAEAIQREILEQYYFVPVFRHAFVNAHGPKIAVDKWEDLYPTRLTTGYAYPWEDIKLKN